MPKSKCIRDTGAERRRELPFWKKLALGAGLGALALAGAEIALRIAGLPKSRFTISSVNGRLSFHSELGQVLDPRDRRIRVRQTHGVWDIHIGEFEEGVGVRGSVPSPDEKNVIVGLGDSFLFGWGLDESKAFLNLVSRKLGKPSLNTGCPWYSTAQYVGWLDKSFERYGPNVSQVILLFCSGNDLRDRAFFEEWKESGARGRGGKVSYSRFRAGDLPVDPIEEMSRLRILRLYDRFMSRVESLQSKSPPIESEGVMYSESGWTLSKSDLLAIKDTCERRSVALAVVYAPCLGELLREGVPFHDQFEEFMSDAGFHFINLYKEFGGLKERGTIADFSDLYFSTDPHWSETGNRLAAGVVADRLAGPIESRSRQRLGRPTADEDNDRDPRHIGRTSPSPRP